MLDRELVMMRIEGAIDDLARMQATVRSEYKGSFVQMDIQDKEPLSKKLAHAWRLTVRAPDVPGVQSDIAEFLYARGATIASYEGHVYQPASAQSGSALASVLTFTLLLPVNIDRRHLQGELEALLSAQGWYQADLEPM